MGLRQFWHWLGDDKNLKRVSFLWPAMLLCIGGISGLAFWSYEKLSVSALDDQVIVSPDGDTADVKDVQLRTALMLHDYGALRRSKGDFVGAEKSFNAALDLIDETDKSQRFHRGLVLMSKMSLYEEMGDDELLEKASFEYQTLFLVAND